MNVHDSKKTNGKAFRAAVMAGAAVTVAAYTVKVFSGKEIPADVQVAFTTLSTAAMVWVMEQYRNRRKHRRAR
jgi:Na+/H+ antiporter NhaD/arsenite permease-like protein